MGEREREEREKEINGERERQRDRDRDRDRQKERELSIDTLRFLHPSRGSSSGALHLWQTPQALQKRYENDTSWDPLVAAHLDQILIIQGYCFGIASCKSEHKAQKRISRAFV